MVASVMRNPATIRVTLLCGRVLSGRDLWWLLAKIKTFGVLCTGVPQGKRCLDSTVPWKCLFIGESLRGKWIGATGPRASERQTCLWEGLWEGGFSESFERFSEVFRGFLEVFRGPLRDPLRGRFPSQRRSVLLPLIVKFNCSGYRLQSSSRRRSILICRRRSSSSSTFIGPPSQRTLPYQNIAGLQFRIVLLPP